MNPFAVAGIVAAVILGGAVSVVWISGQQFEARIEALRSRMLAAQGSVPAASPELPAIMRDYALRAGGRVGDAPQAIHLQHRARLATSRTGSPIDIDADQWLGVRVPGIVWMARGTMSLLPVSVVDAYVEGCGELSARILGTVQVAGGTGPDYDKGELLRYLSELPVHPDAILNATGLAWRQLDERTVEVSAGSGETTATLRFIFDAGGDIVASQADDRPMEVEGRTVPTPWHGTFGNYTQFGRYRIPAYGEVGWVLPDGLFTYWHGTIVAYEPLEIPPAG